MVLYIISASAFSGSGEGGFNTTASISSIFDSLRLLGSSIGVDGVSINSALVNLDDSCNIFNLSFSADISVGVS